MKLKTLYIIIPFVLSLILTGCSIIKQQNYYHAPTFTAKTIKNSKIGIVGVTSKALKITPNQNSNYTILLAKTFVNLNPTINIIPEQQPLTQLAQTGKLDLNNLNALSKTLPNCNYIAFARINSNNISHNHTRTTTTPKSNPTTQIINIHYYSTRTISVTTNIYNLKTKKLAWRNTISLQLTNINAAQYSQSNIKTKTQVNNYYLGHMLSNTLSGMMTKSTGYPLPPSTPDVLNKIFTKQKNILT